MSEKPILFSAPMVRAILDGKKTQTRRVVKSSRANNAESWRRFDGEPLLWESFIKSKNGAYEHDWFTKCPYGTVGDSLWVREAFTYITGNGVTVHYRADGEPMDSDGLALPTEAGLLRWRPSIHMPRWASRINLLIKSIRVERLQDISEDDAKKEGVSIATPLSPSLNREAFISLWNNINGADAWDKNPWVWVVEFEVMK